MHNLHTYTTNADTHGLLVTCLADVFSAFLAVRAHGRCNQESSVPLWAIAERAHGAGATNGKASSASGVGGRDFSLGGSKSLVAQVAEARSVQRLSGRTGTHRTEWAAPELGVSFHSADKEVFKGCP